ncbi:hypothetical protein L873DRAFT_1828297 [Choiromyces venosus 120613-1]|uniref:Uncharacterized protein n=1 Tax=Choiromyces venosus 120613-1 TaxID=1336337 RepID=A0A3N4JPV4_9PEZI|nr:hypothetical protein L873DRAFT_1828297 [Choiromyces venosus 120613-1]
MPASNMDSHQVTTRLHVDELILDYLLWFCTSSLLKERRLRLDGHVGKREWTDAAKSTDMGMRLVNSFTQTFRRLHPNAILPDSIALRQRICCFTTILLRRLDATSPTFTRSSQSSARTRAWLSRKRASNVIEDLTSSSSPSSVPIASEFSQTPFAPANLRRNTEEMHRQMGFSCLPAAQQTYWGNISLREGLKEFMVLSSWTCAFNDEVSSLWMETATNYMVQGVLEAYRCEGAKGIDALNECFSWGPTTIGQGGLDDDETVVNEMFGGDGGSVGVLFEEMKTDALLEALPPDNTPLETHLDRLAEKHTWAVFEETLVGGYLTAVISAQPSPVLLQLENGKLTGFEDTDISTLLANAGALAR